jgi:prepilin-type N-terminal cleavage/methylation domain-containing protein
MMNVFPRAKYNQGLTLIEIVVTLLIIGILATLSAPNLLSMLRKNELVQAQQAIKSALEENQRQALRNRDRCDLILDVNNSPPRISSTVSGCLVEGEQELSDSVAVVSNLRTDASRRAKTEFNFKGQAIDLVGKTATPTQVGDPSQPATIIIAAEGIDRVKCIVISPVVGLIRAGKYTGNTGSNPHAWARQYAPYTTKMLQSDIAKPEDFCQSEL